MPGLIPGIHVFVPEFKKAKTWMAATSSTKTRFALLRGHDGKITAEGARTSTFHPIKNGGAKAPPLLFVEAFARNQRSS